MNLYNFHKNPEELNGFKDKVFLIPELAYVQAKLHTSDKTDRDKLEKAIAKDAYTSYRYAKVILKDRFELGELAILKEPSVSLARDYAIYVIKGPWPEAEAKIATIIQYAIKYVAMALGKPFPLIGDEIKDSFYYDLYIKVLKKLKELGRPLTEQEYELL